MKTIIYLTILNLMICQVAFAQEKNNLKHSDHEKHEGHDQHQEHEAHDEHDEHEEHGHESAKAIGKGKSIEEVSETEGFKLSQEAIQTLNVKFMSVNENQFDIQKNTLVATKGDKGVYRYRNGFFKFIKVKIVNSELDKLVVSSKSFIPGDQIVVNGVDLIRVADVFSTDKSEYGHSH